MYVYVYLCMCMFTCARVYVCTDASMSYFLIHSELRYLTLADEAIGLVLVCLNECLVDGRVLHVGATPQHLISSYVTLSPNQNRHLCDDCCHRQDREPRPRRLDGERGQNALERGHPCVHFIKSGSN